MWWVTTIAAEIGFEIQSVRGRADNFRHVVKSRHSFGKVYHAKSDRIERVCDWKHGQSQEAREKILRPQAANPYPKGTLRPTRIKSWGKKGSFTDKWK